MNHIPCEIAFESENKRKGETNRKRKRERDMDTKDSEINFKTINYKQ